MVKGSWGHFSEFPHDPNRALLDRRVICDLLVFDESVYQGVRRLAQKWCAEPSVHGGKARPRNATLVIHE